MLKHLTKILLAVLLGLIISYSIYRLVNPFDAFLANFLALGLMISLPFTLPLVFYGKVRWAEYLFTFVWLIYAASVWAYMLVGMSTTFLVYFLVTTLAVGGAIFLVLLRRERVGFFQALRWSKEKEIGDETEDLKNIEENETLERTNQEFLLSIGTLNEVQCKILTTLLESKKPYSKKELHKIVKTTYPRTLRAINGLRELGLVEIFELPRRDRGAPVVHFVKIPKSVLENEKTVRELLRKRLEELEKNNF
ncbi:MAG: hypothetical protein ACP5KW_02870 [Thermoproteota archaeon]